MYTCIHMSMYRNWLDGLVGCIMVIGIYHM